MRAIRATIVAVMALAALPAAQADVTDQSDNGFVAGTEVDVLGKSPIEVWQTLIAPAHWWDPVQSWSGDAANLYLDPQAGGCFCELLPPPKGAPSGVRRGSIEQMRIIAAMPPKLLRMSGALGPLQGEAMTGTLTVTLKPMETGSAKTKGGGTRLEWSYVVYGFMRMKESEIAPLVDKVLTQQFVRLAAAAQAKAPAADADADAAAPDEAHH